MRHPIAARSLTTRDEHDYSVPAHHDSTPISVPVSEHATTPRHGAGAGSAARRRCWMTVRAAARCSARSMLGARGVRAGIRAGRPDPVSMP